MILPCFRRCSRAAPPTSRSLCLEQHPTTAQKVPAQSQPLLDRLAGYAINYYEDFVKPTKAFRAPNDQERAAMLDLLAKLKAMPAGTQDAELIQNEVFEVGKAHGFDPLRAWFQALYEVLLGQSQGPRFGSFAAIFGIDRTIALIEEKLG